MGSGFSVSQDRQHFLVRCLAPSRAMLHFLMVSCLTWTAQSSSQITSGRNKLHQVIGRNVIHSSWHTSVYVKGFVKAESKRRHKLAWKCRTVPQIFMFADFACQYLCNRKTSVLWELSSADRSHVGSLLTKSRAKTTKVGWWWNNTYTSATRTDPVHDVTDTECRTQNGSAHRHIFLTFKCPFLTNWAMIAAEQLLQVYF